MLMFNLASLASAPLARRAQGIMATLRSFFHRVAGIWRHAVARREFDRVDAETLRDLGIGRSEFDSYWAESEGLAEPTRRRVIQALCRGERP